MHASAILNNFFIPMGLLSLSLCLSFHGIRIQVKISDLILQLHLLS